MKTSLKSNKNIIEETKHFLKIEVKNREACLLAVNTVYCPLLK